MSLRKQPAIDRSIKQEGLEQFKADLAASGERIDSLARECAELVAENAACPIMQAYREGRLAQRYDLDPSVMENVL